MSNVAKISVIALSVSFMVLVSVLASTNTDTSVLAQSEELLKKNKSPQGVLLLSCVATDDAAIEVQASSSSGNAPTPTATDCAEVLLDAFESRCQIKNTKGSENGAFYTLLCKGQGHDDDDDDDD